MLVNIRRLLRPVVGGLIKRLGKNLRALEKPPAISFDLYETLVIRPFYRSTDVQYLVGKHISEIYNIDVDKFYKDRLKAERLASAEYPAGSSLREVYENMKKLGYDDATLKTALDYEIFLETNFIYEIGLTASILERLSNFAPAILVTDTLLPAEEIDKILRKTNLIEYFKAVYVSSEMGANKYGGKLFDSLVKDYNILLHIDNSVTNALQAWLRKIPAVLVDFERSTSYEKSVYMNGSLPLEVKTIVSGAMRAARLKFCTHPSNHLSPEYGLCLLGTNVSGPVFYLYTLWLLNEAIKDKIDKLFFFSRDGHIIYKIAEIICDKLKERSIPCPELRYLYVSRRAVYPAAIYSENAKIILNIMLESPSNRASLLKFFELDELLDTTQSKSVIVEKISSHEEYLKKLLDVSSRERQKLLTYLEQEGFLPEQYRIGVVDIGWAGSIQWAISSILEREKRTPKKGIMGYYFSLLNPQAYVRHLGLSEKHSFQVVTLWGSGQYTRYSP